MNEAEAAALKAMQDDIYRERILRARRMTVEQRLAEMFAQSNHQFQMIHAAAMYKLDTNDEAQGWLQVRRWMDRLDRVNDHGRYAACRPSSA